MRSLKRTGDIKDAHMMPVRDVDFAHQQEHRIVTGGDDCQVCIWDLRFASCHVQFLCTMWWDVLIASFRPLKVTAPGLLKDSFAVTAIVIAKLVTVLTMSNKAVLARVTLQ